jgi:AcrR family transcriptional regulator
MAYRRTPQIQARLDAQRAAILTAAAALLAEQGYGACSMSGVAARAGVAAGTVYNHFDGKAGLVAELFRLVVTGEVEAVRAAAATGTARERLTAVVTTFAGRALKNPRGAHALLAEPVDAVVDELRMGFRRSFRDVIAAAIEDGVRTGELPPQDAGVVAAALVGAIAEALIGPLAAGTQDADTVANLLQFVHRATGGLVNADA